MVTDAPGVSAAQLRATADADAELQRIANLDETAEQQHSLAAERDLAQIDNHAMPLPDEQRVELPPRPTGLAGLIVVAIIAVIAAFVMAWV